MSLPTTLSLTCLGLLCTEAYSQRSIEVLEFTNYAGKQVVADLYTGDKNEPTVICVELFQAVRESWRDWIPHLRDAGLNVLILDVRGVGPSAISLNEIDSMTHATQYHNMHRNLLESVQQLEQRGYDTSRIALLSSNYGSNILIAAMTQAGSPFRAMVMLTPAKSSYRHLNVAQELKDWSGPPTYMLSSLSTSAFMQIIAKDINKRSSTLKTELLEIESIGNRMLGKIPGIEVKVIDFLVEHLMPRAHLLIPRFTESVAGSARFKSSTLEIARRVDGVRYALNAYIVDKELSIGPVVAGKFQGTVRIFLGERVITMPLNSEKIGKTTKVEVTSSAGNETLKGLRRSTLAGITSIHLSVAAAEWLAEDGQSLRIEFIPDQGDVIALPATGAGYEVHVIDR